MFQTLQKWCTEKTKKLSDINEKQPLMRLFFGCFFDTIRVPGSGIFY